MNRDYVEVMDENTKIREMAALQAKVAKLDAKRKASLFDLDSSEKLSLGGLGGGMLLAGTLALAGWRRREKNEGVRKD
jgi:hydroxylamine dehydrogenase